MNTLAYTDNRLDIQKTVYNTVKELTRQPGYIRIVAIQDAINSQLPKQEYVTRKAVVQAIVRILEKSNQILT